MWLFFGWLLVLAVIYFSLIPPTLPLVGSEGDKLEHVLAYFVLMSWFANLYEVSPLRTAYAIAFVVLGVVLEFVQRWTGYRSFEVADMVANAVGVAAGWIFAPLRLPNYLHMVEKCCWSW